MIILGWQISKSYVNSYKFKNVSCGNSIFLLLEISVSKHTSGFRIFSAYIEYKICRKHFSYVDQSLKNKRQFVPKWLLVAFPILTIEV